MKILVSYITGIGNTIMALPMLRTLHRQLPDAEVDVLVRHQASKQLLERVGCHRYVHVLNPHEQKTFGQKFRFLYQLRKARYDVSLLTFPSNRMEFHLLSFFIGAKRRIALRYEVGHLETLGFLETELVHADPARHETDQNLSLLTPLGVNVMLAERNGGIRLTGDELQYADDFLKRVDVTPSDVVIGFHPGCNPEQGNVLRRWPAEYFAQLGDKLIESFGVKVFVGFGGPEENSLYQEIHDRMVHKPIIPENVSILKTAALIKRCQLFVAGDSGLMHLATLVKVPTVALYGPIDPVRDAPLRAKDLVIKADLPCVPCNTYPHYQYGGSYIRCKYREAKQGCCMQSISVDEVYQIMVTNYADILECP